MNDKILSIVIPTYNMEKYLDKCLTSLIISDKKLFESLEVLVVIDGAKDRSSEIAHNYQEKYPNVIRVIDKENGNYGSCVNRGLLEAVGKYFLVLDADDSFDNDCFLEYLKNIQNLDVDLIINSGCNVAPDGRVLFKWDIEYTPKTILEIEKLGHEWIHEIAYRTEILKEMQYKQTEGMSYTDEEFCFFPMVNVRNFYYVPGCLYKYLVGRDGQTVDPKKWITSVEQEIFISKKMFEFWNNSYENLGRAEHYMREKLKGRMKKFYSLILLNIRQPQNESLINFDVCVRQEIPFLYDYLNDIHVGNVFKLKFVQYWRTHQNTLSYSHPAFIARKIKNGIKKLVGK